MGIYAYSFWKGKYNIRISYFQGEKGCGASTFGSLFHKQAACYIARSIGIEKLTTEKIIRPANMEEDLALLQKLHESEHNDWESLVKNSYVNTASNKSHGQCSSYEAAQYYRSVINPDNSQLVMNTGIMPLPFQFPVTSDNAPDIVSECCSLCMQSLTRVAAIEFPEN